MHPFKKLRCPFNCICYFFFCFLFRRTAVRLKFRTKKIGRLEYNFFSFTAKHFKCFFIAVDENIFFHQENGIVGILKQRGIFYFILSEFNLNLFSIGDITYDHQKASIALIVELIIPDLYIYYISFTGDATILAGFSGFHCNMP